MLSLRCMLQFGWLLLFPEKNLLVLVRWELLLFRSSHILMITAREVLHVESVVGTHLSLLETVYIYICIYNHLHIGASTLYWTAAAAPKSLQSCLTLCDPVDSSPPVFPVPGIRLRLTLMVHFLIILQHPHIWRTKNPWKRMAHLVNFDHTWHLHWLVFLLVIWYANSLHGYPFHLQTGVQIGIWFLWAEGIIIGDVTAWI